MIDTYIINLKEEIQNYHIVKNKLLEKTLRIFIDLILYMEKNKRH